jgi:predicted secreted protein
MRRSLRYGHERRRRQLTQDDSGGHRTTRVGEEPNVVLAENPTTGYRWHSEIDARTLQQTGDHYEGSAGPRGGAGIRRLTFRVLRPGPVHLRGSQAARLGGNGRRRVQHRLGRPTGLNSTPATPATWSRSDSGQLTRPTEHPPPPAGPGQPQDGIWTTASLSTEIHLAVCINSPAARLCLIEDVGM